MYQIVYDSTEQETLACGEESFLNNLVKMFQLPALTLALGTGSRPPARHWLAVDADKKMQSSGKTKDLWLHSKAVCLSLLVSASSLRL